MKNQLTPEMADKALSIINNIDFNALREQKNAIISLIEWKPIFEPHLEGILSLIDNIQDFAVDVLGIDENIVFDIEDECTTNQESIWTEIRFDFQTDDFVHIDGWLTEDDNEGGEIIAKVNVQTKEVIYLDERAKTDYYAQEIIAEAIANL